MSRKILAFSFVFVALILVTGCTKPDAQSTSRDEMIDPVDHLSNRFQTLETAKNNINKATNMQNDKTTQALEESGMIETIPDYEATLHTNKGDIALELYGKKMPITVGNFVKLAQDDFYNDIRFHRVMENFMIQAGDPKTKDPALKSQWGTGGPGYTIEDEFVDGLSNVRGTIAMANTGQANSGGSQWFINLVDNTSLDFDKFPPSSKHPVFGKVTQGMDVIDAIAKLPTEDPNRPIDDVIIKSITIIEK